MHGIQPADQLARTKGLSQNRQSRIALVETEREIVDPARPGEREQIVHQVSNKFRLPGIGGQMRDECMSERLPGRRQPRAARQPRAKIDEWAQPPEPGRNSRG